MRREDFAGPPGRQAHSGRRRRSPPDCFLRLSARGPEVEVAAVLKMSPPSAYEDPAEAAGEPEGR
jgi:hypothetical protein